MLGGWVLEGDNLWGSEDNFVELFPFLFSLYMDPYMYRLLQQVFCPLSQPPDPTCDIF